MNLIFRLKKVIGEMATNVGPQQVQSDIYASSLYDESEVLNIINATSKGIVTVMDERKNIEKRNVNVKGGDVIGKRNNKEGEKPFINYNN